MWWIRACGRRRGGPKGSLAERLQNRLATVGKAVGRRNRRSRCSQKGTVGVQMTATAWGGGGVLPPPPPPAQACPPQRMH